MSELIKKKLDILYERIREDEGIDDLPWCRSLFYPYFLHFNDRDGCNKVGSLIAFWGLLCEWEDGSGFPFYTGKEDYDCHHFDKYIIEFIKYSADIQKQYPNIHFVIIESLRTLDKEKDFVRVFPNIDGSFFSNLRMVYGNYNTQRPINVYKSAFLEGGINL
ncbi:hypothetical protein V7157_22750 [Neobacillus drentensis]|uniref:hypothetical protein n=1 Tax=Neobacillus drentensis TaxID=220684 RepID=UPI003002A228